MRIPKVYINATLKKKALDCVMLTLFIGDTDWRLGIKQR